MTPPRVGLGFCLSRADDTSSDRLAFLAAQGFDGIELWPDALAARSLTDWRTALSASGLRVLQLCPYFNFVHGPDKCDESREALDRFLAAARQLECRRLRVFTGPPWGDGVVGADDASAEQWDTAVRMLREFCDTAAADGVELCLEVHEGSLAENGRSTRRLLDAVDRPNLTVNLQLPLKDEDWQTSLELLGGETTHIHMHNWTEGLGVGELTYFDAGAFDWSPVLARLVHDLGRDVCLSVEHADHGRGDDIWETAARDGAYLTAFRQKLESAPCAQD